MIDFYRPWERPARRPLAIDLFCGLGGWAEGLLDEGWEVVGFDIERHQYGEHRYPGALVIQDVRTLHGSQFRHADLIVASPPCQEYSYRAMPWKKAKALPPPDNSLFDACFRIQREACEAASRHIPLVVENVRGAQKWVGPARANFGSFYLWGDVPSDLPKVPKVPGFRFDGSKRSFQTASVELSGIKAPGMDWSDRSKRGQDFTRIAGQRAMKNGGGSWFGVSHGYPAEKNNPVSVPGGFKNAGHQHKRNGHPHTKHLTSPTEHGVKQRGSGAAWFDDALNVRRKNATAVKNGNDWFGAGAACSLQRRYGSKSSGRKFASALIAKIPLPLARHIAREFRP